MTSSQKGEFGDAFGAFTSVFSAFGFAGVLLTLWHQRQSSTKQSFETTVFGLLQTHAQIIQDIDIQAGTGVVSYRGRDCFRRYYAHIGRHYRTLTSAHPTVLDGELVVEAFNLMYEKHRHNLGHYLRFTYNIFRYIDEADIEESAKIKYSRIVRSQISDYELLVLFYNCLHTNGEQRFKPLVEQYALFNNLPIGLLIRSEHRGF